MTQIIIALVFGTAVMYLLFTGFRKQNEAYADEQKRIARAQMRREAMQKDTSAEFRQQLDREAVWREFERWG